MTTKTDEQERAFEQILHSVQQAQIPGNDWRRELKLIESTCRAALQSQPQETIAYVTRNEEGDPAMLFFDLKEARLYCNPDEEPEALVLTGSALQSQDREDADRVRNAAATLDILTSDLWEGHSLRVEAFEGAKRAVADLYRIAGQVDARAAAKGEA